MQLNISRLSETITGIFSLRGAGGIDIRDDGLSVKDISHHVSLDDRRRLVGQQHYGRIDMGCFCCRPRVDHK